MKKTIRICMTLLLIVYMCVPVFAAVGGFVSSPSGNAAPQLIEGVNENKDCEAQIVITAYGDRDKLTEEARQQIEAAYADIIGTVDISSLNAAIAKIAEEKGVAPTDLAVSDLFDISATECGTHVDHGHFDITLKADTLKNFVCLLHYYNGEWRVVENAEVTNNGEHLEFDEAEFSPFAIVVSTQEIVAKPKKGLGGLLAALAGGASAAGGAGWFLLSYFKKKKKR